MKEGMNFDKDGTRYVIEWNRIEGTTRAVKVYPRHEAHLCGVESGGIHFRCKEHYS